MNLNCFLFLHREARGDTKIEIIQPLYNQFKKKAVVVVIPKSNSDICKPLLRIFDYTKHTEIN